MSISPSITPPSFSYKPYSPPQLSKPPHFPTLTPFKSPRPHSNTSKLYSSKPPSPNGSISPEYPGEKQHGFPALRSGLGVPVYVMLPADTVNLSGKMTKKRILGASLMALKAAGVEGVVVEVWWGIVEREGPGAYDWGGYLDIVGMARRCGLKVRAVMAFHWCETKMGGSCLIPLPQWVQEEMEKEPNIAYADRFGRRNLEYISLGCDIFPVLKGRSPIQVYSDFMRNFRDTFKEFLGMTITAIQVGMGPAGELRYPSCPSEKLMSGPHELGEFQSYDDFMLASLNASAISVGKAEWGSSGWPLDAGNLMHNPERTGFFKKYGAWNTPYGQFFLEWYSGMLLLHGERLSMAAEAIFRGTGVKLSAKVAGIYWYRDTESHTAELTAGYYNTSIRDGYLPIARMFGRHGMALCCTCFDMYGTELQQFNASRNLELFWQLLFAAIRCNVPVIGEISITWLDSSEQIIKSSRFYPDDGDNEPCFSFNIVRLSKDLFGGNNWNRFSQFTRQMSSSRAIRGREARLPPVSAAEDFGLPVSHN